MWKFDEFWIFLFINYYCLITGTFNLYRVEDPERETTFVSAQNQSRSNSIVSTDYDGEALYIDKSNVRIFIIHFI